MFKLPFSLIPTKQLRRIARVFFGLSDKIKGISPFLEANLKKAELEFSVREYLSMCLFSSMIFFLFFWMLLSITLMPFGIERFYLKGMVIAFILAAFAFFQQIFYPRLISNRRIVSLEKNLLAALQNLLVQLNSGIPLFDILVNISKENYGEVSKEFSLAIKEINAGKDQIEVLEEIAAKNPSLFFRRAIWQFVNGMKSGADMSTVISEIINSLSDEQALQIQRYGSQLNPLAMFYMLIAVIMPSLGMTFLIVISSFVAPSAMAIKFVFWGLFAVVLFFQIMFLGVIKSRRPNLLGD